MSLKTVGLLPFLNRYVFKKLSKPRHTRPPIQAFGDKIDNVKPGTFPRARKRVTKRQRCAVGLDVEQLTSKRGRLLLCAMQSMGLKVVAKQQRAAIKSDRYKCRVKTRIDAVATDIDGSLVLIEIKAGYTRNPEHRVKQCMDVIGYRDTALKRHDVQAQAGLMMWNTGHDKKAVRAEVWTINSIGIFRRVVELDPVIVKLFRI